MTTRKHFAADIKADAAARQLTAKVSTSSPDRDGDRLDPAGCQTANFMATGGPVMFAHKYDGPPIARALSVGPIGDALVSTMEFAPTPFAQQIFELYEQGFMKSFSVGFIPGESEPNSFGGRDVHTWELLEYSAVPVPANPQAVALLRAKGLLDLDGTDAPRDLFERAVWGATLGGFAAKGVIAYAHRPLADPASPWDAGKEVAAASVDDLRVMCCWYAGDGTKKSQFKLPHHHASGNHATVWRGVAAAAARLSSTSLPAGDIAGVKRHLVGHYKDFGKDAPWKAAAAEWAEFERLSRNLKAVRSDALSDGELATLLQSCGFDDEAAAVRDADGTGARIVDDVLELLGVLPRTFDIGECEPLTEAQLLAWLEAEGPRIVERAVQHALAPLTGRQADYT